MDSLRIKYSGSLQGSRAIARAQSNQTDGLALVKKAINGNSEAFGDLYLVYVDSIFRYVFYHVMDTMTAEDITEEVFLKAWKAIHACNGKEQTFLSWLYRIAHNQVIDSNRRKKAQLSLDRDNLTIVADVQTEVEKGMERQELLTAISGLHDDQKEVIILKFIEGLDNRQIQRITGKSQGAIRILQMRALATMRRKIGKEMPEIGY